MKNSKNQSLLSRMSIFHRLFFIALFSVFSLGVVAQTKTVKGTVIDGTGEPVIGASVLVKGSTNGVITDIDGNFTLLNVPESGTIQISFVGYKTQDIPVAGKSSLKVTLAEDTEMLDEVVVVGYGVQKKSDVTGALTSVGAEELQARPVSNAFEALQGKAAGVDITTSERPGTVGDIFIRGTRSLTATNTPLYVVDGVPLMSTSGIETLNPRDIESIDILKDASATAIYGSRGANGVVLVTTKSGKVGQFSINYSGSVTTSKLIDKSPSMSAAEFIQFKRWAAYNKGEYKDANGELVYPTTPSQYADDQLFATALDGNTTHDNVMRGWANGTWDASKVIDYDWTGDVLRTGVSQEHTLSASGGTEKMSAYASFGYLNNKGTQIGQEYERFTGRLGVNITPVKWFNVTASMNGTRSLQDYGVSTLGGRSGSVPDAIYGAAKSMFRMSPMYDADGNKIPHPGGESSIYSIADEVSHNISKRETYRILGSFAATLNLGEIYEPLKGLQYKIQFGPDFRYYRQGDFIDGFSSYKVGSSGEEGNNYASKREQRDFSWTLDNMILYNREFGKHKFGLTLLQSASSWNIESTSINASALEKDSYLWNAFGSVDKTSDTQALRVGTGLTERQLESYMVRLNYGFNDRYLLTVSGRWDGASQLAEGHKWDFFPSAALGWRIQEEAFMQDIKWINNLKLRVGVGTTGNAGVAPYTTKGDITSIFVPGMGGVNIPAYTTNEPYYVDMSKNGVLMANPELGWEKTTQWNVGIDFGVLDSRITGSIDFYTSKTKDLLMSMSIPSLTGFANTMANVGRTSNKGIEVSVNALPVLLSNGFMWETNLNMAYQKSKIEELAYGKNDMVDNSWFIGEQMSVYYGYKAAGIWQDTEADRAEMAKWNANGYSFEPGMVRMEDMNGDYKLDPNDDRVILGNRHPNWTLGWSNTFAYKGVELSFQILGRLGYTFDTGGEAMSATANQRKVDYWTPENTGASYQKPMLSMAAGGAADDYYRYLGYQSASFLKMRNISLGYNVPSKVCQRLSLKNLKVYAQCNNPFSIYDSVEGFDLDTGRTYFNRSFSFGLEIGF
ncbi:TonB-dependent receptor [uncultured Bacteroides sp.]|uniref:SusC/RagA family TonB-linked outer membrane protein n=1 Tax=uncultured Bacteroides sp. TaxID=162156 RepID=UPI00260933B5|nr:TonB-dependent receptor [uncultured Bacteroides sp.]